ncbi:hypothetical protein CC80DRAFT_498247 [Byssothecium circinans]|uniref:Uncharacterized protein n=1 Tax=Byssothecium circinans TaxID=147558 RepID=A0A6A5T765_9PLEO|nr:hypothetical protein CC80DRAFT_498247 [Byssothecium circinans]
MLMLEIANCEDETKRYPPIPASSSNILDAASPKLDHINTVQLQSLNNSFFYNMKIFMHALELVTFIGRVEYVVINLLIVESHITRNDLEDRMANVVFTINVQSHGRS